MRCQFCGYLDSRVIDSRPTEEGSSIRRRRECLRCGRRFTTYEKIETAPVMVIKKDMRREPFDPNKIKKGLLHACQKRPVSMKDIDGIVEKVEKLVHSSLIPFSPSQAGLFHEANRTGPALIPTRGATSARPGFF